MEDNVNSELIALAASGMLSDGFPAHDNGAYIRLRYQRLWNEITQEEVIGPSESLRIQERIRALNALGFSVGGIEYYKAPQGEQIRLRVLVTDRNFHRDQLFSLTGLEAEEMQARLMMNEIHELRAALSKANQRSTPMNVAAYHWMVNVYQPVIQRLQPLIDKDMNLAELYCQVLEHKWYLSEKARRDVGHDVAVEDYVRSFTNIT
jgi:hypothetical protein